MTYAEAIQAAFLDELEKIGSARRKFLDAVKSRAGRRPMRVATMLKKEKDGTLFKLTKTSGEGSVGNIVPFSTYDPQNGELEGAAKRKLQQGEVPSREDGREQAAVKIPAGSQYTMAPAATTNTT